MKKICAMILSAVLAVTFCFPMSVAAASSKYHLSDLELEVTVPEGYVVVTRDTPDNDPIFNELGTTKAEIIRQFEAVNIYLNALSDDWSEEIVVTMDGNSIENFSLFSDTTLNVLASTVAEQYADYDMEVLAYEIYQHSQAKFIKLYFTDTAKTVYGLQYYTVYDNKALNFTLRSTVGSISSRQELTIKAVVDSIVFDNAPPVVEEGENTDPFQYTDEDSGVTFTVPANWQQKAFTEDRELIDVKFVSTKEAGCAMIYGSIDIWAQMSELDRIGYTRSQINNNYFNKAEIAEIYGIMAGNISTVTYNGVQYFKGEIHTSSDVYGLEIPVTITQLLRIENGWMYLFQFSGTRSHKLYPDFEKWLNSMKYPEVPHVEETEPTKQTTSNLQQTEPTKHTTTVPDPLAQDSADTPTGHSAVIAVIVLLGVVAATVVAVVITGKKKKKSLNHSDPTSDYAPEIKPLTDTEPVAFCRKCGEKLIEDSRFCGKCGTQVVVSVVSHTE